MKKAIVLLCVLLVNTGLSNLNAQIKIGDHLQTISPFALLELESTSKGLIIPRMTTAQRDAAFDQSTPFGVLIFNSDNGQLQYLKATSLASQETVMTWVNATDAVIPTIEPEHPERGELFYNASEQLLLFWNEGSWLSIGGPDVVENGKQRLSVSEITPEHQLLIEISNGNSQTIDFSSLANTDQQNIKTFKFDPITAKLTLEIDNGNKRSVNLSALKDLGTDSQIITATSIDASNTFTISISNGNDQVIDLSPLITQNALSTTDSQTLTISSLSPSNTLSLAISGGNTVTLDLSPLLSPSILEDTGQLFRTATGTTTHDFVFGSDQLDNQTGSADDARFFFDKSKAAFRAGYASGNSWDEINIGERSFGMGYRTQASGDRSIAIGNTTEAQSYAETVFGSYNTIVPPLNTTSWNNNDRLFVIGNGSSAANKSDAIVVLKNGNIGIGDSTPTEGNFVVSGTIVASGDIIANQILTPDYVFEKYFTGKSILNPNYRFLSIEQVEDFVKRHHHLPQIPSALEVKKQGGIVLNRALEIQLEKIEELYLYTLEQEKRILALEKKVDNLVSRDKKRK
ncbi:MAG: hypothetical protein ACPHUE_04085 [Flavobacteriaceae bacterium]